MTSTTSQPGAAIPPDDANRKLTVADPDDPKLRHVSVAGGTYPILGDPSLGASPAPSGGLVSDMMSAANQLGAGQAIDLLKGMIMPGLMQAAHGAAAPAAPPALPAPPLPTP